MPLAAVPFTAAIKVPSVVLLLWQLVQVSAWVTVMMFAAEEPSWQVVVQLMAPATPV